MTGFELCILTLNNQSVFPTKWCTNVVPKAWNIIYTAPTWREAAHRVVCGTTYWFEYIIVTTGLCDYSILSNVDFSTILLVILVTRSLRRLLPQYMLNAYCTITLLGTKLG